jgi:hypothetical protein
MSTPIPTEEQRDEHLVYAPPWARTSNKAAEKRVDKPWRPEVSRPMAPGIGGPNLDPLPKAPTFEGDVGIIQLRRSLSSLEPDVMPHPPFARQPKLAERPRTHWAIVVGLSASVVLAAVVASGVTIMSLSSGNPIRSEKKGDRSVVVADASGGVAGLSEHHGKLAARLVLETRQAYANEPLPLRLAVNGASGNEHLLVKGLNAGTRLSAGIPLGADGWRLAPQDIGNVLAYPPKDFVGAMNAAVDLRSPRNALVDSQMVRLEWLPGRKEQPPRAQQEQQQRNRDANEAKAEQAETKIQRPALQLSPEQIQTLLDRGRGFLKLGDIAAARLVLKRAADAGSASAALELGATYDPEFLKQLGVLGFAADAEQARTWYRRASDLGSSEAAQRIDHLAQAR